MSEQHSLTSGTSVCFSAEPTARLRFVLRDGKRILQQAWSVTKYHTGTVVGSWPEWRDIPLEDEHG